MYAATMEAVPLDPIAIRRHRQSDRSETVRYISGSAVRGALAAQYLRKSGIVDDDFERLFISGECRFGCLDPDEHLAPLTAMACKRGGVAHRLWDSLWERMVAALRGFPADSSRRQLWRCPVCDSDMKPLDGFFYHVSEGTVEQRSELLTVAYMHVGIDRLRGSAAEQILYSIEALAPRTLGGSPALFGTIRASDPALITMLRELTEEPVYVGYHRTSGYGRCQLQVHEPQEVQREEAAWASWSEGFIQYANALCPNLGLDPASDFFFAISLPNGAIVMDSFLRYSLDLSDAAKWLPRLPMAESTDGTRDASTPFADGTLTCLVARTRHELVRGWNVAHGIPRLDEFAIDRGAVYAYRYQGGPDGRKELVERLSGLIEQGIGFRLVEGFGEVRVSDPFHAIFGSKPGGAHAAA